MSRQKALALMLLFLGLTTFAACSDDAATGQVAVDCPDNFVDQGGRCVLASPIEVLPATAGPATVGRPFIQQLSATGGQAPYAFDLASGDLAPGLSFSLGGELAGTPTRAGVFTFTARATDGTGSSGQRTYALDIREEGDCPAAETCGDGADNNCNGAIDEGCEDCVPEGDDEICQDLSDNNCDGQIDEGCGACTPTAETCNGLDDDCDGTLDEDVADAGAPCPQGDVELCRQGTLVCRDGALTCEGAVPRGDETCDGLDNDCDSSIDEGVLNTCGACGDPDSEACDGVDNDCDGVVDEGCPCEGDQEEVCGSEVGACTPGTRRCVGGAWGECEGATLATAETCDGLDNDCDGTVDNGVLNACGSCGAPAAETCNGLDDDCDGATDEDLNDLGACTSENNAGSCEGRRICQDGQIVCDAPTPAAESCDGLDNDCDDAIDEADEGTPLVRSCAPDGCDVEADQRCVGGQWSTCQLPAETCNGLDDDCDGAVDDDPVGLGQPCGEGPGLCTTGQTECVDGAPSCEGAVYGSDEVCNGMDDDCDMQIDEEIAEVGETCTGPTCLLGTRICAGANGLRCDAPSTGNPPQPGTLASVPVEQGLLRAYTGTTDPYITPQGSSYSVLIASDGDRIYNVAQGINGTPFAGWTVRVFQPTAAMLRHVETFSIPTSWADQGAPQVGIVGVAADGAALWVTNIAQPDGGGIWRIDLNARAAEFVTAWGNRLTFEGGAEYDWNRDVFWTIQFNVGDPGVFQYSNAGISPATEVTRFGVNLPDGATAGAIASSGVHLFGLRYSNTQSGGNETIWRFGSGFGGTVAGGGVMPFAMAPAAASMTYHRDGALYIPDQSNPMNVRRVTVLNGGAEVCDGIDNNCNGSVDEGVCNGVDLDVISASAVQVDPRSNGVFVQYDTYNRGSVASGAFTDQIVLRVPADPNAGSLGTIAQPTQAPFSTRASQLIVQIPTSVPSGQVEIAIISDALASTPDINRANNTRGVRFNYSSPFQCDPDRFEPNNARDQPTGLDRFTFQDGLRLCSGDEDWYRIVLPPQSNESVFIGFSRAQGNLDAYLWDASSGQLILSAASDTDNEILRWTNNRNSDRTFLLQIVQNGNAPRIDYSIAAGNF